MGLFIIEEYVGPSRFQRTDLQLQIIRDLLQVMPAKYRRLPNGRLKMEEARPTVERIEKDDPFEAVRSAEILPLFYKNFTVLHQNSLGGTIQNPLYHDIMNNFDEKEVAGRQTRSLMRDISPWSIGAGLPSRPIVKRFEVSMPDK
jgi:hypothetical protein